MLRIFQAEASRPWMTMMSGVAEGQGVRAQHREEALSHGDQAVSPHWCSWMSRAITRFPYLPTQPFL